MEKHGKELGAENPEEIQKMTTGLNFYAAHDNKLEMLDENDHDMLLDDVNDDEYESSS